MILESWSHSQILFTLVGIWILYSFVSNFDYYKFLHNFKCKRNKRVDAQTEDKIKDYWKKQLNTGVRTFHEIPLEGLQSEEIEKHLDKLAKVSYNISCIMNYSPNFSL
jgi:hypothetical protein